MATYTPKRLVDPFQVTTSSSSAVYTVSVSGSTTVIKEVLVTNPTATPATISVFMVPSGGSAGNSTAVIPGITVAGNSILRVPMSAVMNYNDAIRASASAGSTLTLTVSGVEITA